VKPNKEKVVVGMSGGVDSSVTAAILKRRGYHVSGVFMLTQNYTEELRKNAEDVRRVCEVLSIPLEIIDARDVFKKEVMNYFLEEYEKGRTPNPCVFCNKNFKFKILLAEMNKLKADYVATGHYAQIKIKNQKSKVKIASQKPKVLRYLYQAKDESKDQSYFLYTLGRKELSRIIFPLGEYKKTEVREMAKEFGLPVHDKIESQDICFLGGSDVTSFLKKNLGKLKEGKIISTEGKILGTHKGLPLYTIGQRKGISIGGTGPYYVAAKDEKKNELIVASCERQEHLFAKSAVLDHVNWIGEKPELPYRALIKVRYQAPSVYGIIEKQKAVSDKQKAKKELYRIIFENEQRAVTAGQSAVFYGEDGEVIGGGVIA